MAKIDAQTVWELASAISGGENGAAHQRTAEVTRIDRDGTVWVHVLGGVDETPVKSTASEVSVGDVVDVQWGSNAVSVAGNSTAPATSARGVERQVAPVKAAADMAERASKAASGAAAQARAVAEATNQHFWTRSDNDDTDGAGAGAFVTDMPQDEWLDGAARDFDDLTEEKPYANFLLNSLGGLIRRGKNMLASFTRDAIAFYDGEPPEEGEEPVELARFGNEGARIGPTSAQHIVVDSGGMCIYGPDGGDFHSVLFMATADGIILKNKGSEFYQELSSTKNSFMSDAGALAWFGLPEEGSGEGEPSWEMHISTAHVEDMLRFGDYAWIKRQNGNMSLKWLE